MKRVEPIQAPECASKSCGLTETLAGEGSRARIEPSAWRVVRRFHPLARPHIQASLQVDGTGRIRELADVCPGTLVFAAGLALRGGRCALAARELLSLVAQGRRLGPLLLQAALEVFKAELASAQSAGEMAPARSCAGDSVKPWVDRLRVLIRRASSLVSPLDLCGLPPPVFAPEDIPGGAGNARWFASIRLATDCWLEHDVPAGAWSFLSRHAASLHRLALAETAPSRDIARVRATGEAWAGAVVRRGKEAGRWPCRATSPRVLVGALRNWIGEMTLADFEGGLPAVRGVKLEPVRTVPALEAEGRRMRNCLAQWRDKLRRGGRWVFVGHVNSAPVNVDVRWRSGRYVVEQALGPGNQPLTDAQRRRVIRWLRALNGETRRRRRRSSRRSPDLQLAFAWARGEAAVVSQTRRGEAGGVNELVIVVDDDISVARVIVALLEHSGYRVRSFGSPQDALRAIESEQPAAVVSDDGMPGMSGFEFLRLVRAKWPHVGRVLVPAGFDVDAFRAATEEGLIVGAALKPFRSEILLGLVAHAVARAE